MLVPKPPAALEGHCSVIHDNTLYTYSSNGFASIPLERNGNWTSLPAGELLVSDAACVIGGIDGNENQQALYVVGGRSESTPPGLQRYSFKDQKWKTLPLEANVLSNRTSHSAVYLKSLSSIFIYGGDINGTDPNGSASTLLLDITAAPYVPQSQNGANVSPASSPNLLTWSDEEALFLDVASSPAGSYLWNSDQQWHDSGLSLRTTFPSDAKFALLRETDVPYLQLFDLSDSPSTVRTFEVLPEGSSKQKRERPPNYDDTLAPTTTRQDYSLAQSEDSLVVISSGSGTDALSIFNQTANSWVNATKLFYGDMSEQEILGSTTTTTTTTSSPTTTPSVSPTPSGSSTDDSSNDNIGTIIGATLGGLLGVAAILILILFVIKRKKEKMRRAGGLDKDRLSFQDQGVEPLTRSAYPMAQSPAPKAASSVDSLAIFSGGMGDEKSPRPAGSLPQYMQNNQPARPSPLNNIQSSDTSDYSRDDKAIEAGETLVHPGDRTTDEGWGKYFQNNSTPTLVGMQSHYESARGSKATIWPGSNNALPPLDTSFLQQPTPLGRVNSGSPTTEFATSVRDGRQIAIPESQSARISSADSASIISEEDADRYHNVQTQSWLGRPPSSAYSRSFYNPHQSTRELPSTITPTTNDYRKHDSARTNTRGSSILIPDDQPLPLPRNNVNSDMSWLNLNADR
ncbi:hypothetical protein BDV12DRAFT_104224 [Aspergillus spectabilis]